MENILSAFLVLSIMGAVFGLILAIASKVFAVKTDDRLEPITQGLGYTVALVIMCIVRELLGSGTFGGGVLSADGIRIIPEPYPAMMLILPVGGFLTLGCLIAFAQWLVRKLKEKEGTPV